MRSPLDEDVTAAQEADTQAGNGIGGGAERDIIYAAHDCETLLADWYGPAEPGRYPTLIAVHGGGWQRGDRSMYRFWGPYLARRGYVVLAISYRLSKPDQKSFPEALHDVCAAIRFARSDAARLKIDPERIALIGDSAGAHLSALAALASDHPKFAGAYRDDSYAGLSARVKAVVGIYGVYDLASQWNHDQVRRPTDQICEKLVGAKLIDDRQAYFDASPISYAVRSNNATSFFLVWGTGDDLADPATQSKAFLLSLKQAGFFVRTAILTDAPHFWSVDPIEEPGSYTGWLAPRLLRFLAERL